MIGESVFIYSLTLNEVIEGRVEGFSEKDRSKVKILQKVFDGYIRHIVSHAYVFRDRQSAILAREETSLLNINITTGMTVHLKINNVIVTDEEDNPLLYQVVADYEDKVALVTYYGESIGKFNKSDLVLYSPNPLFSSSQYEVGQKVSWIVKDSVYEGVITRLREKTAEIMDIRKLYPVDTKVNVPYYKISGDLQEAPQILTTVIGDNLED